MDRRDFETFITKFPIKLNQQQREAVQAVDGPVLLLAVPGSGKTTVLVTRLGYMIYCQGVQPANILTLTYTVAATNDMRERFCEFFGPELASRLEFRTINSICAGVIQYYGAQIGKNPYELESDEKVLIGILASLYQQYEEEYPTESDLKGIKTLITYIKNSMLSEQEIRELEEEAGCHLLAIYKAYCSELKSRCCMDYDDQMVYAYRLLKSSPGLLDYYQNRYPYICVDEAQDTSKIQHEIIALLASKTENLFMVGDEDQSIYGFRAAYPAALLNFEQRHPGARVLLMEENFRSNANIVSAADGFIQKNMLRREKHMKATKERAAEIKEISLKSRNAQYSYLLKIAQDCATKDGAEAGAKKKTAVLYRDNESAIPLVDLLERNGVPYRIRNAELSFFTHRVVMDIENIMRFALDMRNADLFEQIYYKIATYLSKQMALQVCALSREYNISVFSAISGYLDVRPRTRKSLKALEAHLAQIGKESPQKTINRIVQYMGYGDYMERTGAKHGKIFILKALAAREDTAEGFLNRMEKLKNIIQNKQNDRACSFILSTIHGSKGLEYDNVYMIDVQDGIFPEQIPHNVKDRESEEVAAYEEERRLFYVGATRAKDNLYLFRTQETSTFINQLLFRKPDEKELHIFAAGLAEGTAVTHKSYGHGVITETDGTYVKILFDGAEAEKAFNLKVLFQNRLLTPD